MLKLKENGIFSKTYASTIAMENKRNYFINNILLKSNSDRIRQYRKLHAKLKNKKNRIYCGHLSVVHANVEALCRKRCKLSKQFPKNLSC